MYHVFNHNKINQFETFPLWQVKLFISQVWWFSPLHHRFAIEYQYSCQYSYEYPSTCPRVQVRVLLLWNSRVRVQYEYQKFNTRVLQVRVPSTSNPALVRQQIFIALTNIDQVLYGYCMIWLHKGPYSLSGKTSYRQISRSLEAARLGVII